MNLARRYMGARKGAFISVGTVIAVLGVMLGTAKLAIVMSVTGGFRAEFREKVLGVNAHVLVLKYSSSFPEYRDVMDTVAEVPGVVGVGPFVINPMMVTHEDRTATGVLVKGVDPARIPEVLDVPRHMVEGSLEGLRLPGSKPPKPRVRDPIDLFDPLPPRPPPPPAASSAGVLPDQTLPFGEGGDRETDVLDLIRKATAIEDQAQAATSGVGGADGDSEEPEAAAGARGASPDGSSDWTVPEGAVVGAIEPEGGYQSSLPEDDDLPEEVVPDPCKLDSPLSLPGTVIGQGLKETLGVKLGDCIQVTSPTIGYSFSSDGKFKPPVAKLFRVTGVFNAGFDQYDSKLIYTDLYEAQAFYDSGDTVTGVEMKVSDIDNTHAIVAEIGRRLKNGLYKIMDWEELNRGLFTALRVQQILMSLVLALIILVAAFTVLATQIMVVLDKKREIAVLKAMGATDFTILRAFLYQGLFIGIGGAGLGLALGYAICRWIPEYGIHLDPKVYFISKLPVQIRPVEFLLVGVFAVTVCLIGTLWPALYAARLRPAEAFREQ